MVAYENQRVNFDRIARMYREYLTLYRFFNHGSTKGATPFDEFYWVHHYYARHSQVQSMDSRSALA